MTDKPKPSVSPNRKTAVLEQLRASRPVVLPSMLLCDFSNLAREMEKLEEAGVEAVHMDVMDGVFVPNMTYGMPIIEAIRRLTKIPIDVHLMIQDPGKYAKSFVDAGADLITFHVEAVQEPEKLVSEIQSMGIAAGVAINPSTTLDRLTNFAKACDLVLVMSVEAGFGGQAFHPEAVNRLRQVRSLVGEDVLLEVDGGINVKTAGLCRQAGADLFVVGSAIFRQSDYSEAMTQLYQGMQ